MTRAPTFADILEARTRIAPHVRRTPVLTSPALDRRVGARLHFKCENLQAVGAFKARGATNAVMALGDEVASRGVVTHSSGNHGAALAFAASLRGIPAWIVMPENAPKSKQANVRAHGGEIRFCAPTLEARETTCAQVQRETGATLVHPFDDDHVIAGQGTVALELLDQVHSLDAVITPCGGGGLLSGTAIAVHGASKHVQVYGAEPRGADDAQRSLAAGHVLPQENPRTIADGLRTSLSERTFSVLSKQVAAIATCSEEAIVAAMRLSWETLKVIVEPSSAVPLACLIERTLELPGREIGIVISGGNVDLDRLPWQA
ncbi:MAG TPA: pyridoxal-phosphate dependent enzyme [Casimicrobiaceae bacterium]|nr:pyridoxal-phosphate dependent enzyme [Casimicrobiaceae bacterium]